MISDPQKIISTGLLISICVGAHTHAQQFSDVTAAANLEWPDDNSRWRRQVLNTTWVDYDGDGLLDLYVSPHTASSGATPPLYPVLFRNLGNGTFSEMFSPFATVISGDLHEIMWADYDNDGDPDLFIQQGGQAGAGEPTDRKLYRNDGANTFSQVAAELGLSQRIGSGRGCLWFDWDKDGKLDICLFNSDINGIGNYSELMQQTSTGFVKRNDEAGFSTPGFAFFGVVSDIFGDNKPDLVVLSGQTNDLGFVSRVYENASTSLVDRKSELPSALDATNGRDGVIADFNNDLIPDFLIVSSPNYFGSVTTTEELPTFVSNQHVPPLYVESGSGGYSDRSTAAGFTSSYYGMAVGCGDFDNDGDLDVYMAGQVGKIGIPARYYRNDGNGTFTEIANASGADFPITGAIQKYDQNASMSFCIGDYDNDGFLDIYKSIEAVADGGTINVPAKLFRNNTNSNHWLQINLVGTDSNRDAIGTKVILTANGKSQLREQTGQMRRIAQDMKRLHFGLGSATSVSSIVVYWPNGQTTTISNITADQIITISELDTPANYTEWAVRAGLPGDHSGLGAPTATPAGDGVENALKYAFYLSPYTNGLGDKLTPSLVAENGADPEPGSSSYLSLKATLPKPLPKDIIYTPTASSDLQTWPDTALELYRTDNLDGTQSILWRDVVPTETNSRRFMRLDVTIP